MGYSQPNKTLPSWAALRLIIRYLWPLTALTMRHITTVKTVNNILWNSYVHISLKIVQNTGVAYRCSPLSTRTFTDLSLYSQPIKTLPPRDSTDHGAHYHSEKQCWIQNPTGPFSLFYEYYHSISSPHSKQSDNIQMFDPTHHSH